MPAGTHGRGKKGLRRASRKPRRAVWWVGGVVAASAAAGAIFLIVRSASAPSGEARPDAFSFPCLQMEGAQQHIHPYLRIFVNGHPVPVPAAIGIRSLPGGACLEPVHTHDASGIIHIESHSQTQTYTLADFFTIWRATYPTVEIGGASYPVSYTLSDLFNHRPDGQGAIRLLVDGAPSRAGPLLVLNTLDYCSAAMAGPPCAATALTDPYPPFLIQRYGTGHTIVLEYRGSPSP